MSGWGTARVPPCPRGPS